MEKALEKPEESRILNVADAEHEGLIFSETDRSFIRNFLALNYEG